MFARYWGKVVAFFFGGVLGTFFGVALGFFFFPYVFPPPPAAEELTQADLAPAVPLPPPPAVVEQSSPVASVPTSAPAPTRWNVMRCWRLIQGSSLVLPSRSACAPPVNSPAATRLGTSSARTGP